MNTFVFASHPAWLAAEVMTAFIVGTCVGLAHFGLLRQMANILLVAGGSVARLIAFYVLRFLATGAVLYLAGRVGALALLATLVGILAARQLVIRGIGGAP